MTFSPAGVVRDALPTLLLPVLLLLTACGGPSPDPAASPVSATPDIVTVSVEQAPPVSPVPSSPVALATASPIPATVPPALAPSPTPVPPPTVIPTLGPERLLVAGGGSPAVNMRSEPGTGSGIVKSVRDGTEVIVIGTDRESDGRIWRNVQDGDVSGWIVSTALRPQATPTATPSSPSPSATPTLATPTAASSPTATVPASATVSASATATATPTPAEPAVPEGEPVEVFGTGGQGANLRAEPGTGGQVLQTLPDGTHLTVIGPDREVGGQTWRHVRGDGGTTGWIISEAVRSLATPSPTPTASATATAAPTATPEPTSTPTAVPAATATVTPSPTPSVSEAGTPTPSVTGAPTATPSPAEATSPAEPPPSETEEPTPEPETVEVYGTGGTGANLRIQPGRSAGVIQSVPDGAHLTIIGDDETVDGLAWRHVQTGDGVNGWLAQEVVRTLVTPTATPRPGAPGIGAPIEGTPQPETELTDAELAARPCRPGQVKGDASTGFYYAPDHPDYPGLLQRVRCFDDASRARASGFRPPEPSEASPSPVP